MQGSGSGGGTEGLELQKQPGKARDEAGVTPVVRAVFGALLVVVAVADTSALCSFCSCSLCMSATALSVC